MRKPYFGMIGVIAQGDTTVPQFNPRDMFEEDPEKTVTISWQAEGFHAWTAQSSTAANLAPGSHTSTVPHSGDNSGLVFGQFFDLNTAQQHCTQATEQFNQHNTDSFTTINGAWVGCFWNQSRTHITFARGLVGVGVLYLCQQDNLIYFATDVRLFQLAGLAGGIDHQAIVEFLHYLYVPPPRSLHAGILSLLSGHYLQINNGDVQPQQRYTPSYYRPSAHLPAGKPVEQAIEEHLDAFEEHFTEAVRRCLPADGEIALTLSRGKDSSAIAIALSKLCPERVTAYTVGFANISEVPDESEDAARIANHLGLRYMAVQVSDALIEEHLPLFTEVQGQPMGDIAALSFFILLRSMSHDTAVILDGSGNGHYFGGLSYSKVILRYTKRRQLQQRIPEPLWHLLVHAMTYGPSRYRNLASYWKQPIEETFISWFGWTNNELERLFSHKVSFEDTYLWQTMRHTSTENMVMFFTEYVNGVWAPASSFRKGIDFANAIGFDYRYPYMDLDLANFVHNLPTELKHSDKTSKVLLRAYLDKYLPTEITHKPKQPLGFDVSYVVGKNLEWLQQLRRAGQLDLLGNIHPQVVEEVTAHYLQDPTNRRVQQKVYALCLAAAVLANLTTAPN